MCGYQQCEDSLLQCCYINITRLGYFYWLRQQNYATLNRIVLQSITSLMLINDQFSILAPINFSAKSCSLAEKRLHNNIIMS